MRNSPIDDHKILGAYTAIPKDPQKGPEISVRPERESYRPGEAIYQATKYLAKAASPERRKVIIVITQSFFMMAKTHLHSALEVDDLLKKTGTTVYALLENNGKRSGYGGDQYNPVTMIQVARDKQRRQNGGSLEDFVALTGSNSRSVRKRQKTEGLAERVSALERQPAKMAKSVGALTGVAVTLGA